MKIGSELASNPRRIVLRSGNDSLQNCVGVHLRLKPAQDCGLVLSVCTKTLFKLVRAFFRSMLTEVKRVVVVDQRYRAKKRDGSQMKDEVLRAKIW